MGSIAKVLFPTKVRRSKHSSYSRRHTETRVLASPNRSDVSFRQSAKFIRRSQASIGALRERRERSKRVTASLEGSRPRLGPTNWLLGSDLATHPGKRLKSGSGQGVICFPTHTLWNSRIEQIRP